ncbi:MAG: hypothetical protein H6625_00635 [Bdellovibrionaceae bacterium]|nr:hypothetical protein [Pseudobdellovibrionaceae bacterium]
MSIAKYLFILIYFQLFMSSYSYAFKRDVSEQLKDKKEEASNLYKLRLAAQTEYNAFVQGQAQIRGKLEDSLKATKYISKNINEYNNSCGQYENMEQYENCYKSANKLQFALSSEIKNIDIFVSYFSSLDKKQLSEVNNHINLLKTWLVYATNLKLKMDKSINLIKASRSELAGVEAANYLQQFHEKIKSDSKCLVINHTLLRKLYSINNKLTYSYTRKQVPVFIFEFNKLIRFKGYINEAQLLCPNLKSEYIDELQQSYDSWKENYQKIDKIAYVELKCEEIKSNQPNRFLEISEYCQQRLTTDNFLNTLWQFSKLKEDKSESR